MASEFARIVGRFRFAPHLGLLEPGLGSFHHAVGRDPVSQINFAAEHGFSAVQDNFLQLRDVKDQERIGRALARHGMTMGSFVATMIFDRPTFASCDPATGDAIVGIVRKAIEAAKRVNGSWLTLIPGQRPHAIPDEKQKAAIIDNLKRCAEIAEAADVVLLLETLNSIDRPGMALPKITEAAEVVRAVQTRACRLVFDVYHVQVESGDIIRNIDRCWNEIGYFQFGDNPGRCEPGTGEINFARVLSHIWRKGYRGLIDMEHHASQQGIAGEQAVLQAYAELEQGAEKLHV
jgi:hydroxypyruvate isomerase